MSVTDSVYVFFMASSENINILFSSENELELKLTEEKRINHENMTTLFKIE